MKFTLNFDSSKILPGLKSALSATTRNSHELPRNAVGNTLTGTAAFLRDPVGKLATGLEKAGEFIKAKSGPDTQV